jgi:hypothetical protein
MSGEGRARWESDAAAWAFCLLELIDASEGAALLSLCAETLADVERVELPFARARSSACRPTPGR